MSKLYDEIGQFTTVPNTVMKMMRQIGNEAFSLWCYLRYKTNSESGVAFPEYSTIKSDTGLSYKKIATSLRRLESLNLMKRKKRFGSSSEYTMICPSPTPVDSKVLYPLTGKSSQRVQTIKTDSIKTDNIQSTGTAAVENSIPDKPNIFRLYEQNIGTLTPMIADELKEAEKEYPAEWIPEAFAESVRANVRKWNYTRAILENWKTNGKGDHRHKKTNGRTYAPTDNKLDLIAECLSKPLVGGLFGKPKND